jgi:prepilin-type N-terminal cleavage/methylation domain-containing protein
MSKNGMTLLELLVVISLMVLLGGSAVATFDQLEISQSERITTVEQQHLAKSLLALQRDTGINPRRFVDEPQDAGDPERIVLNHLIDQPTSVADWNHRSRLGWRGPYIDWHGRNPDEEFLLTEQDGKLAIQHIDSSSLLLTAIALPQP